MSPPTSNASNEHELEDTTAILELLSDSHPGAAERLMPRVYEELKAMAAAAMRRERAGHTLQPTALVNEVFLRLINHSQTRWEGRAHFCAAASTSIRHILISHARKQNAKKRGGLANRIPIHDDLCQAAPEPDLDILELDRLLSELHQLNPRHARIIELRFFSDLTIEETATALGVSDWTVKNDWRMARAWLLSKLDGKNTDKPQPKLENLP